MLVRDDTVLQYQGRMDVWFGGIRWGFLWFLLLLVGRENATGAERLDWRVFGEFLESLESSERFGLLGIWL